MSPPGSRVGYAEEKVEEESVGDAFPGIGGVDTLLDENVENARVDCTFLVPNWSAKFSFGLKSGVRPELEGLDNLTQAQNAANLGKKDPIGPGVTNFETIIGDSQKK